MIKKYVMNSKREKTGDRKWLEGRLENGHTRNLCKGDVVLYQCGKTTEWKILSTPEWHASVGAGIAKHGYKSLMPWCKSDAECLIAYYMMFFVIPEMRKKEKKEKKENKEKTEKKENKKERKEKKKNEEIGDLLEEATHWDKTKRKANFITWADIEVCVREREREREKNK